MKIDLFTHFFPKRYLQEFIEGGYAGKDIWKRARSVAAIADLGPSGRVL